MPKATSQARREVDLRRQPAPAEDPQADEGRLEEERHQPLHRQRRAEDVADVAGVQRPVHAELELLDDARDDADRHRDQEELAPEAASSAGRPRCPSGSRASGRARPTREPDRHRHEDEVEQRRDAELRSRPIEGVHRRQATFDPGAGSSGGRHRAGADNYAGAALARRCESADVGGPGGVDPSPATRRFKISCRASPGPAPGQPVVCAAAAAGGPRSASVSG